ncbi:MAG: YabP/YqfC family sporulation protein [Oscillospiraceae bacterium]|nr:YabP/YqfC family sporulation protein [Oscillospiraceae bacterium]
MRKRKKENIKKIMSNIKEVASSMVKTESRIEMIGNKEAIIEGCNGVIEYDDFIIRIATKHQEIRFVGDNLQLKCLTNENIIITGFIKNIEFID